jgi:outer membrane receptor protein involved in Fe transport
VKYQLDGVEVSDPLFGRGASVANLAVASADVLSGGFDAEYGNALSGIVNVQTREGGPQVRRRSAVAHRPLRRDGEDLQQL